MTRKLILALLLAGPATASGQADSLVHQLPFASEGNTVELAVANTSAEAALENVTIHVETAPEWLTFTTNETELETIASGEEAAVVFLFDVNRNAPVGEAAEVVFRIEGTSTSLSTGSASVLTTKTIHLEVEAPRTFALSPNYPNPFNPSTTLAFELPQAGRVVLTVYDVLGREIVRLAEGDYEPGRHEVVFDARNIASGLYIARFIAETEDDRVDQKDDAAEVISAPPGSS